MSFVNNFLKPTVTVSFIENFLKLTVTVSFIGKFLKLTVTVSFVQKFLKLTVTAVSFRNFGTKLTLTGVVYDQTPCFLAWCIAVQSGVKG